MLKVLLCPINYGGTSYSYIKEMFDNLGCQTEIFDFFYYYESDKNVKRIRQNFLERAKNFRPDLCLVQIQHTIIIDGHAIKAFKELSPNTIMVNWTVDCRNYVQPQYYDVSKHCDYNLICSTGQLDMYREKGVKNVYYWQTGYNSAYYNFELEHKSSYEFDAVLVANYNGIEGYPGHSERVETVRALNKAFGKRFALFGSGWPKDVFTHGSTDLKDAVTHGYHRGYCAISVSHFNNIQHYWSDRLLMCLASGRPTISWNFPGYQSYFTDRCDLMIAHSPEDIVNKVRYLLNNPDLAQYIGVQGSSKVAAEHTWQSRIDELLDLTGLKNKL
jgi:spore maturation protein CgeB